MFRLRAMYQGESVIVTRLFALGEFVHCFGSFRPMNKCVSMVGDSFLLLDDASSCGGTRVTLTVCLRAVCLRVIPLLELEFGVRTLVDVQISAEESNGAGIGAANGESHYLGSTCSQG